MTFFQICLASFSVVVLGALSGDKKITRIKLIVNAQTFTATLLDSSTATAFKELLPLTIQMTELNGNEKYGDLKRRLPTNSTTPPKITNGDLMLYGAETLVIFYKTIATSYPYTKLGQIDNATGLASALGSGNVNVTFELD